jgi:hypothetical protein
MKKGTKRAPRDVPSFGFQVPAKGDRNRVKEVAPYLLHNGRPIPICARRLLVALAIHVNDKGCTWHGERSLLAECQFSHTSLAKARRVLKAAGLIGWSDVANSPDGDQRVNWVGVDARTNYYAVNFAKINEAYSELVAERAAARAERKKARDDAKAAAARCQHDANVMSDTSVASATLVAQTSVASATLVAQTSVASATPNSEIGNSETRETMKGACAPTNGVLKNTPQLTAAELDEIERKWGTAQRQSIERAMARKGAKHGRRDC